MMGTLNISMFGEFSISYKDKLIDEKSQHSRKSFLLLAYLIAFRKKAIPQMELFEVLWKDGESDNPINALRTLLSRTRTILSKLDYPDVSILIKASNGSYFWNNEISVALDTDIFEEHYNILKKSSISDDNKITYGKKALELYTGNFLSNYSDEYWVVPMATYYNSIFINIVNILIDLYTKKDDYLSIVELCNTALAITPYEENFYYNLINALYETGNSKGAIEQYKNAESFLYANFGVSLSSRFSALYKKICNTKNNLEFNLEKIHEDLVEKNRIFGAFMCDYELFKQQFQLEIRASQRNGYPLQVCLVSVVDSKGKIPPLTKLNNYMKSMENVIRSSLRASDIFARFSVSQYIIMLTNTTLENAKMVLGRIDINCRNNISISGVRAEFDLKNYAEVSKEMIRA